MAVPNTLARWEKFRQRERLTCEVVSPLDHIWDRTSGAVGRTLTTVRWEALDQPAAVLDFLIEALDPAARMEMDARKRREVLAGLSSLMLTHPTPEVLFGLGMWVEDRQLANANILQDVVTSRLERWGVEPGSLDGASPWEVLFMGSEAGLTLRQERGA